MAQMHMHLLMGRLLSWAFPECRSTMVFNKAELDIPKAG